MVKIFKFLGYVLFFLGALVFFMPKSSTYYYVEHELKKHKIIFSKEELVDNGLSLQVNNSSLSYDGIDVAEIKRMNVKIFGLYNSIKIEDIILTSFASSFLPIKIDSLELSYTIVNPLQVNAYASGEFGSAQAMLYILDRNVSAVVIPSKLMLQKHKKTLSMMKKQKNGEYNYDKTF